MSWSSRRWLAPMSCISPPTPPSGRRQSVAACRQTTGICACASASQAAGRSLASWQTCAHQRRTPGVRQPVSPRAPENLILNYFVVAVAGIHKRPVGAYSGGPVAEK